MRYVLYMYVHVTLSLQELVSSDNSCNAVMVGLTPRYLRALAASNWCILWHKLLLHCSTHWIVLLWASGGLQISGLVRQTEPSPSRHMRELIVLHGRHQRLWQQVGKVLQCLWHIWFNSVYEFVKMLHMHTVSFPKTTRGTSDRLIGSYIYRLHHKTHPHWHKLISHYQLMWLFV